MITASAPGKLFLFGEYAVLEGHLAIIAAVDRRAIVRFEPGAQALQVRGSFFSSPVALTDPAASRVLAGVEAARAYGARVDGGVLDVDSRALFDGDRKLGFGSSAAVCVATFAAVCAASGVTIDPVRAFPLCKAAHNRAQGTNGSGGDVAASLVGGLACLRGESLDRVQWVPPLAVAFHPVSASTPAFVSNVKRYKADAPADYARHTARLGALAEEARAAAEAHDAAAWVRLVRDATKALDDFGRVSGTSIVTDYQRELCRICDSLGGASKPAGAGGGDVSLIVAPDAPTLERIVDAVKQCEPLKVASSGVLTA